MDQERFGRYLDVVDELVETLGTTRSVYHDTRGGDVHVDIYIVDIELAGEPRVMLLTVGLGLVESKDALELAMLLPASWELTSESITRPEVYWPFAWLRYLGGLKANGFWGPLPCDLIRIRTDPTQPRATRFAGVLGVPGEWIAPLFEEPIMFDDVPIFVTALIAVDAAEIEWAADRGEDAEDGTALAELLEPRAVSVMTVDEDRVPFVAAG